ncbi:MAG TPA: glycosyltransferase [Vicinamibacterales bacterium]|nr:glycosyltransferase [Vicinamibacterales bacterium]
MTVAVAPRGRKVLHVISGLYRGGAETQLCRILGAVDRRRFEAAVVSLVPGGGVRADLESLGVPVHCAGMTTVVNGPWAMLRLARLIRRLRPDILQGWMYHGNLAASLGAALARWHGPVLWNVRNSLNDLGTDERSTVALIRLGAWFSGGAAGILYNAHTSAEQHEAIGYCRHRRTVIPNGYDCDDFRPVHSARDNVRRELGLSPFVLLVGLVGRYHPKKGHGVFLEAAAHTAGERPDVHFLLAGRAVDRGNGRLGARIAALGLTARVHLLGERFDLARIYSALDLLSTASFNEGSPGVVGEAMACGTPCVVTDVGDAARVVGDTGTVVPPREPAELARAWMKLLSMSRDDRAALGHRARRRIEEHFSLASTVRQYEALYEGLE